VQLAVTGSSSRLLSREIATTLRGRSLSTEIFPFSFREALVHEGGPDAVPERPGARKRAWIENRFRRYLGHGGFPEVQSLENEYRVRILQEYVDVVILRDIVERYQVGNVLALRYLIRHLLAAPASLFSVTKFHRDLGSQGIASGRALLYEYFDYLADAYLVYPISIHSPSERARRVNPRKVYAIDTGLANAFLPSPRADTGRLLENFVFMELRRRGMGIEYYRTAAGNEVDFITTDRRGRQALIQVSLDLRAESTRARELQALTAALSETGLDQATLVTMDQEETIDTPDGHVRVMPAWRWALGA